jgi:hypothetical protein
MKGKRRTRSRTAANATESGDSYDLKFVPIGSGKRRAGGWYRELPDHQLEVMSRGHLERVALEDADPEEKAKAVVKDMLERHH